MKILVFSDSHGRVQPMLDLVDRHRPDVVFHLGDLLRDGEALAAAYPQLRVCQVPGNCDYFAAGLPAEDVVRLADKTIFYLHGHTRNVKLTLRSAQAQARALGADVLLYGHTHIPHKEEMEGLLTLNPGALKDGRHALLTWEPGGPIRAELCLA